MKRGVLRCSALTAVLAGVGLVHVAWAGSANPAADLAAAEAAAFAEADANGDGKLTPEEFADFGARMRQKLDALRFTRLDTNADGVLTREEVEAGRPPFPPAF